MPYPFEQISIANNKYKIHVINLRSPTLNKNIALELQTNVALFLSLQPKDVIVLVDLEQVKSIDSDGLTILLTIFKAAIAQKVDFILCALQPQVRLVMEISRMERIFTIFPDHQALINHLTLQAELETLKSMVSV